MIPWYSVVYFSRTAKQSTFYKNHGRRFIFAISSALYNSMLFDLGAGNSSTKLLWVWFSSHSRRVDTLVTTSLVRCFLTQTLLCRLLENRLKSENCFNYLDNWKDWFKEAFPHKFVCDVLKLFPGVIRVDTSRKYRKIPHINHLFICRFLGRIQLQMKLYVLN